jgi:hypothetical protein
VSRREQGLLRGVILLTATTRVVVAPLTRRVLLSVSFQGRFPTIEAGLLLIDVMLLALLVVTGWCRRRVKTDHFPPVENRPATS